MRNARALAAPALRDRSGELFGSPASIHVGRDDDVHSSVDGFVDEATALLLRVSRNPGCGSQSRNHSAPLMSSVPTAAVRSKRAIGLRLMTGSSEKRGAPTMTTVAI